MDINAMSEKEIEKKLIELSRKAMENSYSPYSKFRVGAAILTQNGKVYTGVNVENASFGATICAERTAVIKAVSEGDIRFKAIALSSDADSFIYPCGVCRQVFSEFDKGEMKVICSNSKGQYRSFRLSEMLPNVFEL
ncbi:MAG TPA: cytidine deaminase [Pseudobacteroides sp.]|uniref:cytidine deaminase n=1 Tax=Pseudobacteroides sp. TaxID=1968840 RepID=UPI002F957D1D